MTLAAAPISPEDPVNRTILAVSEDRIAGFRAGADDYLGKPFEPEELVLRLRSLLRRAVPAICLGFTAHGVDDQNEACQRMALALKEMRGKA